VCVAVCCSILQCVAVRCRVLQCVVLVKTVGDWMYGVCVAVCCSVLQYVTMCCSVLQCVAMCGTSQNSWRLDVEGVLQCVVPVKTVEDWM